MSAAAAPTTLEAWRIEQASRLAIELKEFLDMQGDPQQWGVRLVDDGWVQLQDLDDVETYARIIAAAFPDSRQP